MSNKYSQKLLSTAKNYKTDAIKIKNASKRALQETEEAAGDLFGNKIGDKIASISKNYLDNAKSEIEIPKERYISLEKRQQIIDEIRLI